MTAAIVSAVAAIVGVISGSLVNFFLDKSRRREERVWDSSAQQLRLYAEFLSLASRWLMEINWASRNADPIANPEVAAEARRTLEEFHRETLIPFGMIRMVSSPTMAELAQIVLSLCQEHQQDYEVGRLNEEALWANHDRWVAARTNFTEQAHKEHSDYLRR